MYADDAPSPGSGRLAHALVEAGEGCWRARCHGEGEDRKPRQLPGPELRVGLASGSAARDMTIVCVCTLTRVSGHMSAYGSADSSTSASSNVTDATHYHCSTIAVHTAGIAIPSRGH